MFSNRNKYYKRLFRFIILVVLGVIIIYYFSIKKTINMLHENTSVSRNIESYNQAKDKLVSLETVRKNLSQVIETSDEDQMNKQRLYLLEVIGQYCLNNNLLLKELVPQIKYPQDNYLVTTQKVVLQGNFKQILVLVSRLEKDPKAGKVISLNFFISVNKEHKNRVLISEIYIQSISLVET